MKQLFIDVIMFDQANDSRLIFATLTNGRFFTFEKEGQETHVRTRDGQPVTPAEFKPLRALFEAFCGFLEGAPEESVSYGEIAALDALVPWCCWDAYGPEGEPGERAGVLADCAAHFTDFWGKLTK